MVLMMFNNVKHVFFGVFWGWFCWVLTWFILVPGGKWFLFPPFSGLIVPSIFFSILKYPLCRHVLLFLSISIYIYTHIYTVFGFRVLWAVAMIWSCYLGPNIFFSKSCTECFGFFHNIFEFFCRDAQMHTSQWCIDSSVWKNWVCHSHHMLCFQSRVCFAPSVLTIGWFCFRHFHHPLDLMDFCNELVQAVKQPLSADAVRCHKLTRFQWLPRSPRKATPARRMNSKGKTPKKKRAEYPEARWRRQVPRCQCGSWSMKDSIGRFHITRRWRHPRCFPFWNAIWSQKVSMPGVISLGSV